MTNSNSCTAAFTQMAGMAAIKGAVKVPATVKCRIGIDDRDSYEALHDFVRHVRDAGTQVLVVHARKAILQGLSPKENREIPPLRYDVACAALAAGRTPNLARLLPADPWQELEATSLMSWCASMLRSY